MLLYPRILCRLLGLIITMFVTIFVTICECLQRGESQKTRTPSRIHTHLITEQNTSELQRTGDISRRVGVDQTDMQAPFVETCRQSPLKQKCELQLRIEHRGRHLFQPGASPIAIASSFSDRSRDVNEHVEPGHDDGVSVAVKSGVRA